MSTAAKRRLRTDLLTILFLVVVLIGAFAIFYFVDAAGDLTNTWAGNFYSWLLRR